LTNIETLKLALEALKTCDGGKSWADLYQRFDKKMVDKAITALRTAIKTAEKQEPVAWMDEFGNVFPLGAQRGPKYLNEPMKPLYTTPPAAQQEPMPDDLILSYEKGFRDGAAQPAPVQEPVAWMYGCVGRGRMYAEELDDPAAGWQPLYTTPPAAQRQPLTDEKINEIAAQGYSRWVEFARAIEAAHGIKGEKT
jgi:hypothetical protein